MRNEKLDFPILMQFLYLDWCIDLCLILLRYIILQRYYYDVTIKTIHFVYTHVTATNKGELAYENAAYEIIALEFSLTVTYSHVN